jgi:guanylate kinase|tara:strand:+ start:1100 stop:1345 length:246 start_codon:yes stop_codon:yes gene_type:complete
LEGRKVDPKTGVIYNADQEIDAAIEGRLVTQAKDTEINIRKRFDQWKAVQTLLEENFRGQIQNIDADLPVEELENLLADII